MPYGDAILCSAVRVFMNQTYERHACSRARACVRVMFRYRLGKGAGLNKFSRSPKHTFLNNDHFADFAILE